MEDSRTAPATVHPLGHRPEADCGPGSCLYAFLTSMDANREPSIFNISQLRTSLERLDLNEAAKRTIEIAEDYMPGCAWLNPNGEIHFAETMGGVEGLVLCSSREQNENSLDEVPFWVASWLDELFPGIAESLRTALALASWGNDSAPEME